MGKHGSNRRLGAAAIAVIVILVIAAMASAIVGGLSRPEGSSAGKPASPSVTKPQTAPTERQPQTTKPKTQTKPQPRPQVRYVTVNAATRYIRTWPTTVANRPVRQVHRGQKVATVALVRGQDPYRDGRPYWVKTSDGRYMWAGNTNAWLQYHQRTAKATRSATRPSLARRHGVGRVVLPVAHYHLTARFGQHGRRWKLGYHTGLDFAAPRGTPVRAVAAGYVTHSHDNCFGRMALLKLVTGEVFMYAHLSGYARSGQVGAGDIIGYIGTSGRVTGPHLHLEYRPHGGRFGSGRDPLRWFAAHRVHVPNYYPLRN